MCESIRERNYGLKKKKRIIYLGLTTTLEPMTTIIISVPCFFFSATPDPAMAPSVPDLATPTPNSTPATLVPDSTATTPPAAASTTPSTTLASTISIMQAKSSSATPAILTSTSNTSHGTLNDSGSTPRLSVSQGKLSMSPFFVANDTNVNNPHPGSWVMLIEVEGVLSALQKGFAVSHKKCEAESHENKQGLCTAPFFECDCCGNVTKVPYSTVDDAGNRRSLPINKFEVYGGYIGGNYSSLQTFCVLMGLPTPVSKNTYTQCSDHITDKSIVHAEESIHRTRQEAQQFYGAT